MPSRSDVDFASGQKGRVRLDQSIIHCNWSASTMASRSRCYFGCFIRERLGECGRSLNVGRQALPNMGLSKCGKDGGAPDRIVLLGTTTYSISKLC